MAFDLETMKKAFDELIDGVATDPFWDKINGQHELFKERQEQLFYKYNIDEIVEIIITKVQNKLKEPPYNLLNMVFDYTSGQDDTTFFGEDCWFYKGYVFTEQHGQGETVYYVYKINHKYSQLILQV